MIDEINEFSKKILDFIEIPKSVLVCDVCNKTLVDELGNVLTDCIWIDWGLVCKSHSDLINDPQTKKIEEFSKEGIISRNHQLFTPMKIGFF